MIFKNPIILYGLFFLIVPIIVHLFQLRKFSKVAFTNVDFLKPLINQTRKSRQLKKWLTLLARCLAVACIVIAFAQPFLPGSNTATQEKQTAIYLDNSFSMELNGKNGPLYKNATSQLLEKLPADKVFTLFTNDKIFTNTNRQQITNELLANNYSSELLSFEQIQLKASSLLDNKTAAKEIIFISDFQNTNGAAFPDTLKGVKRELVKLEPQETNNISIDTAFIVDQSGANLKLQVDLSSNYNVEQPITLTLENNTVLLAKTSVLLENQKGTANFDIEIDEPITGRIYIEDQGISFDNELFISTGAKQKIKVLSINGADSNFLDRLYNDDQFEYLSVKERDVNYNLIKDQNIVVINEVSNIPASLSTELNQLTQNGGYLVLIPAANSSGYDSIGMSGIELNESSKKITEINFNHPLFKGVFNKRVTNFQYPSVQTVLKSTNAINPILKYEDGSSFLYKNQNTYVFTSGLNLENSNFQSSPLIVPVFYNMAMSSLPISQLYYDLDSSNAIAVNTTLNQDQIISLSNGTSEFIPRQQAFDNYVLVNAGQDFSTAGNYDVTIKDEKVSTLSFNAKRQENQLKYYSDADLGNNLSTSINDLLYKLDQEENILSLWKYFVMGALFFLICEILILKFVK
ncbi:putative membrane protein (TIGR02226 family) [Nonlabens dokdonensis]|uniref:Inter-alpha-trypsin inhibitor heavy chain H2-like protein n=2 Tax=Nonlabens dokdonensis TaxID=328515 RepID=L7WD42_NONDD|nr:BatA domain-containing protein [Nonlabens dokdonensis]AGC78177.1 inter-alpha-trypsin inhibitor heavy chain H2-like protein [Nonlabens dokdonensis DSW-6]PZX37930.1 putative membrane protein (TIGR02226 family) [Nonlabens dokdonensis]